MILRLVLALVLLTPVRAGAQVTWALPFPTLATVPPACTIGDTLLAKVAGTLGLYVCTDPNVWTQLGWSGSGGAIPTGAVIFMAAGTCPATYTELSALNGRMIRGTVAANGNVGTTGGTDSYTPAGSNTAPALTMNSYTPAGSVTAPTFTGTAWSAPSISWPVGVPTFAGASGTVPAQTFTGSSATSSAVTAGTPAGTNAAITAGTPAGTISALTTGADSSTTGGVAKAIAQTPTFTGSALATHTHVFTGSALATHSHTLTATGTNGTVSFTPTGTVAWPAGVPTLGSFTPEGTLSTPTFTGSGATLTGSVAAPAFTGTPATITPAYLNLIACSKN